MEYGNVRITDDGIYELDAGRKVLHLPRESIESIRLRHGATSERPLLQLIFGLAILAIGLYPLEGMFNWFVRGGRMSWWFALILVNIPLGAWMIWAAVARGYFLSVQSARGARKVVFGRGASKEELDQFIEEANAALGYNIMVENA